MKKITIILLLIFGCTFHSCETIDTSENEPINRVAGEIDDLLEEVQLDFPRFIYELQDEGAALTRINYLFGESYDYYAISESERNEAWSIAYDDLLPKIEDAIIIAEAEGYTNHLGVAKVFKALTLMTLVDFYGDVPYSDIGSQNPSVDDGAIIYAEVLVLLEEAIDWFNDGIGNLEEDYYYNNDFQKWAKLANTLQMNVYLNTRLVDTDALTNFNAIANAGNFISTTADDFEFNYANANLKHPDYALDYRSTGALSYRSNWLMDTMMNQDDSRIRYYFYRQNECTPGSIGVNGETCITIFDEASLSCSVESAPGHYPSDMTFCTLDNGYWGRDHGDSGGIPPDVFRRSATGVYPAAGKFDDDEFAIVTPNAGGMGAGILPLMLASWVDFMQSEMALANGDSGAAQDYIALGMQKSIDKVMGSISLDPNGDVAFAPTSSEVSNYITTVGINFNNGDINTKFNILGEQQFISQYGNGINSYNMYRRTGFPTSLQFHLTADSGPFVRSLLYPVDEVNDNTNISQKSGVDVQVFWDTNPGYPAFPFAN